MPVIDLNCDMGESFGAYSIGADTEIMPHITSANVACGFHAGDPSVMRQTVLLARQYGVSVGAHPGYDDKVGFGRRFIDMTYSQARDAMVYQIGALMGFTRALAVPLCHVKCHGAIYNAAAKNMTLASALADAVKEVDENLIFVALSGSLLIEAGKKAGLRVASEAFADRAYLKDGNLVPRGTPGAVLKDHREISLRVARMVREGIVIAADGTPLSLQADTICVHGDTPGAALFAKQIRESLASMDIGVVPLSQVLAR